MVGSLRTLDRALLVRRCVACGYDGALLKDGRATRCARCGCDLRRRPARSYAEMEGLVDEPGAAGSPTLPRCRGECTIQRWLVFMLLAMIGAMATLYLAAAAIP